MMSGYIAARPIYHYGDEALIVSAEVGDSVEGSLDAGPGGNKLHVTAALSARVITRHYLASEHLWTAKQPFAPFSARILCNSRKDSRHPGKGGPATVMTT